MFKEILKKTVDGLPGALGAIFADWEGESVEYQYAGPEDDIKLLGAHQGILLGIINGVSGSYGMGEVRCVLVSAESAKLVVRPLKDGYYLVVMLGPYANGGLAIRAVEAAAAELMAGM